LNFFLKKKQQPQQAITRGQYKDEWFPIGRLLKHLLQVEPDILDEFPTHSLDNKQPDGFHQTFGPQNFDDNKALETSERRGVPTNTRRMTLFPCKTMKIREFFSFSQ